MGQFINIGNRRFQEAVRSEYVDKTALIAEINRTLCSERRMSCVTRCRRFGKSMAAAMLRAYYDKSCSSRDLFKNLEIEKDPTFEVHLNKYPVIFIDMTYFTSLYGHDEDIVEKIKRDLIADLKKTYPEIEYEEDDNIVSFLLRIATGTDNRFLMIIDEWDAICREFKESEEVMNRYVDFLRLLFKNPNTEEIFVGAYITGILPIKKYDTQSALNNFREYSMVQPGRLAPYFGFTKQEVEDLCHIHGMDFEQMEKWYDGYRIGREPSMFNPNSVMCAINNEECVNYWSNTGAFESVSQYIKMNFDGLKDDIISMLANGRCKVDYGKFRNDLQIIKSKDDVLTILIHLGYLAYDPEDQTCYIPNLEVKQEMLRAVEENEWSEVINAITDSKELLKAVLDGDEKAIEMGIEKIHQKGTSILSYNDENSLACVLTLAFFSAQDYYIIHRELPSGKGLADLIFIPRKNIDIPAIIMELKCDKDTISALEQIKNKDYVDKVLEYTNNIILVGINYNRDTKHHTCQIEKYL